MIFELNNRTNPTTAGTQEHTKMQNAGPRPLKSFDPSYTRLYPDQANVVVMKSSDVSIYLDRALKALGLVSSSYDHVTVQAD